MRKFIIALLTVILIAPVAMSQDTVYVKTFDDLGDALKKKLTPLEQLKALPHEDCNCEECMTIKNKVADEVDAIYIDTSKLELKPWQSRSFHKRIHKGMKKIEKLNKLGDKIRNEESLRHRHSHHKCSKCKKALENKSQE